MPQGPFRREVDHLWRPATNIGLSQDWAIFSPNPRSQSLDLYAVVVTPDGSTARWDVPEFDPVVGVFRQYRWHGTEAAEYAINNETKVTSGETVQAIKPTHFLGPL